MSSLPRFSRVVKQGPDGEWIDLPTTVECNRCPYRVDEWGPMPPAGKREKYNYERRRLEVVDCPTCGGTSFTDVPHRATLALPGDTVLWGDEVLVVVAVSGDRCYVPVDGNFDEWTAPPIDDLARVVVSGDEQERRGPDGLAYEGEM